MADANDLADFIRSRRNALRPADVGLPDTGRRRTPGLRREEVAALAGVSIDYLVRIEQGRDVNPSMDVLDALAVALRLNREEREHLLGMAMCKKARSAPCAQAAPAPEWDVPAGVRTIVERLDPTPAFVVSPWLDVLASNGAWERLVRPLGLLDGEPPNLARFTFAHPSAPDVFPDWATIADEQASRLRSAAVRWSSVLALSALVDELHTVAEFADRWDRHTVAERHRAPFALRHPAGELTIDAEDLTVPDGVGLRVVTWLPADDATAERITAAIAEPRRGLRIVADA